jgi:protease IV
MTTPTGRRGWFFWFTVVAAAFVTLAAISFYLVLHSFQVSAPAVSKGTSVTLDLAIDYPEDPLYELGGPLFGYESLTFRDLILAIREATKDDRVQRLLLNVRGTGMGWAHAAELRAKLVDFKSSGKKLTAFIEYGSNRDYFLASAADEIYIHPRSILDLRGVRAETLFLKNALDKLGVEPEFERIGRYKDAPDMFLRDSMSATTREAFEGLVKTIGDELVQSLVDGRGMDRAQAESIVARGPFTADEAKELDLVDGIGYLDDVQKQGSSGDKPPPNLSVAQYRRATAGAPTFGSDCRIALIYGIGAIVGGDSSEDAMFGRVMGSDTIARAFKSAREDASIDAVVFRIDSPGGSDVASDVIWREASLTKEKKPVIVSMGDVAASGGYWIATASSAIVAEPSTITGSIGIYAGKFNLAGLFEKLGVATDGVSTAGNADFFSASRRFTPEERERLHHILEAGYQAFLERVSAARGKTVAEVDAIAQGRVWSGRMALERGLVDEMGGLDRAVALAREKAGFGADASVELRIYPEKKNLIDVLLSNLASGTRSTGPALSSTHVERLDPEELLRRSPLLRLFDNGSPLALMPYRIRIY